MKAVRIKAKHEAITEVFKNMLDPNCIAPNILWEKINIYYEIINGMEKIYRDICGLKHCTRDIKDAIDLWFKVNALTTVAPDIETVKPIFTKPFGIEIPTEEIDKVKEVYKIVNSSKLIEGFTKQYSLLKEYKKYIYSDDIHGLMTEIGLPEYNLLSIANVDITEMLDKDKEFHEYLKELYGMSKKLCKTIIKPNVDIDQMTDVIHKGIMELKQHLPHCDKAFHFIERKLPLLKSSIQKGYSHAFATGNPASIFTNIISELETCVTEKKEKGYLFVKKQLKEISNFIISQITSRKLPPEMEKQFSEIKSLFTEFEKGDDD
jgi:hypothetical protein